jgi:hypothetical protein
MDIFNSITPTKIFANGDMLYFMQSDKLCEATIDWKHNRPVEDYRIGPIVEYIKEHSTIDGSIYVGEVFDNDNDDPDYVVYDGAHRVHAFQELDEPIEVEVRLKCDTTHEQIFEHFGVLNRSKPVSDLYLCGTSKEHTDAIKLVQHIRDLFVRKYPTHISNNRHSNRPNITQAKLDDELFKFIKSHGLLWKTPVHIFNLFMAFNDALKYKHATYFKQNKRDNVAKMLQKCANSGCYLFMIDFTNKITYHV